MSEERSIQQHIVETAIALNATGMNSGRSGNVSARQGDGLLITASGSHFDHIGADEVVAVDASGNWRGAMRPSTEMSFHLAIYKARPDIEAVVHVHSPWATTLACMHKPIPAFHYMVAVVGGRQIPCVPYATFGSEALAVNVADGIRKHDACLLANHGLVAVGVSLDLALELAQEVEHLARCYAQALSIGEPALLTDQQMDEALAQFRDYRKPQA